jgi:hypothetical protein
MADELVPQDSGELDIAGLEGLGAEGLGLDSITSRDLVIPRIAILQALSPAVNGDNPTERAGDIFNVTTQENYGRSIEFITLAYWISRTKWETPDITSPVECIASDGEHGSKFGNCASCPFSQWSQGKPPQCTEFKNLLILPRLNEGDVSDSPFAIYAAKRASIRPMNRFLTSIKMLKKGTVTLPIFASIWEMKSEALKGPKGTYFAPSFRRTGFITNEMVKPLMNRFNEFKAIRDEAMKVTAQANANSAQEDGEAPTSDAVSGDTDEF